MTRPLSRWQALTLGLVAVAALAIGGWRIATLPRSGWNRDAITVTVLFQNVAGLQVGTRVHLQGVDVGEVATVDLPEIAGNPVTVKLRLASHLRTRLGTDAGVSIARENPLGDRIVKLLPGAADSPRLDDGVTLVAQETPDLFDGLAQTAGKLNQALSRLDHSLAEMEAGKGSLGKLLKDDLLYNELAAAAKELKSAAYDVRQGDGTIGSLVKDRAAYEKALETVDDVRGLIASVKQNSDAVKSLPVVRNFVIDAHKELVRPDMKRMRKIYAEDELFEPGRAVLTDAGRTKLDAAADWLKGTKTGEVMIAGIAAPGTNAAFANTLTQKQSDAVRDYLVSRDAHRTGWWWWNTRPVRSIACGNQPPSQPETETLPATRIEVILFVAEK